LFVKRMRVLTEGSLQDFRALFIGAKSTQKGTIMQP
jgi:hypothetical protein